MRHLTRIKLRTSVHSRTPQSQQASDQLGENIATTENEEYVLSWALVAHACNPSYSRG
jgi:hypothetical protein